MNSLGPLIRVRKATLLSGFMMRLEFEDGKQKDVDLEPFLRGTIFKPIREDPVLFQQVSIEGGTIVWPNGADIDPDVLYYDLKPAWMEEPEEA